MGFYEDCMKHDRADALKILDDIPTHVLVGTRDVLTPPAHARRIADHVSGAVLTVAPDAGPHAAARARPAGLRRAQSG